MSTSKEFVEYVCEQIHEVGFLRYKKMFGEYMIYVNDKPILLVSILEPITHLPNPKKKK